MFRSGLSAVSVLVVLVLITPVFRQADSFPISTQPMYAAVQAETSEFITAQGRTSTGVAVPLSIRVIAETDDPLIAQSRLQRVVDSGGEGNQCARVADRVSQDRSLSNSGLASVEVVRVRHDIGETAAGRDGLVDSVVLASCTLPEAVSE